MTQISLSNLDIVISNVEFASDPENGSLDEDACDSILACLKELREFKVNVPDTDGEPLGG